jgi:hypothetical protein
MRLWLVWCLCLSCLGPVDADAQGLRITDPHTDALSTRPLTVRGTAPVGTRAVEISIGEHTTTVSVEDGKWTVKLEPGVGTHLVEVRVNDRVDRILVTIAPQIFAPRKRQNVRIAWTPGAERQLADIADKTLATLSRDPKARQMQIEAFVIGAKHRVTAILVGVYKGLAIDFDSVPPGAEQHKIIMLESSSSMIFGQSQYDCENAKYADESEVWVGSIRKSMVNQFVKWSPMSRDDALPTRIDDVAHVIARTAAHELGHSLGLVGSDGACSWMGGCEGNHNCESFDAKYSGLAKRFGGGRFIMDSGEQTPHGLRLGEPLSRVRSVAREPAELNGFDRSYLGLVLR